MSVLFWRWPILSCVHQPLNGAEPGDRRASEALLGRSFAGDAWPDDALPAGARVQIVQDSEWAGPWRQIFSGIIDRTMPPRLVPNERARPGDYEYLVSFDQPQHDFDGGGPYRKAVIWARYLRVV